MPSFFRYRNMNSFLYNYHELEKQEIYFATKKQENDVMEGWRPRFYLGKEWMWRLFWLKLFSFVLKGIYECLNKPCKEEIVLIESKRMWGIFYENETIKDFFQELDCSDKYIVQENLLNLIDYLRNYICYLALVNSSFVNAEDKSVINGYASIEEKIIQGKMSGKTKLYWEVFPQDLLIKFGEDIVSYKDLNASEILSAWNFYEFVPSFASEDEKKDLKNFYYTFPQEFMEYFNALKEPLVGIASFSKKYNDLYMWAIYADRHRGVCLEFKADENNCMKMEGLNVKFEAVKYENKEDWCDYAFNELNKVAEYITEEQWKNDLQNTFEETHLIKSIYWKHEDEYRIIIRLNKDSYKRKYELDSLKSITFGMWASNKSIIDTIKVLRLKQKTNSKANIAIYKMYKDHNGFERKLVTRITHA